MIFYNKNSRIMKEIEDKSVHLVVTSPMYPMIEKWDEVFGTTNFGAQHSYLHATWQQCWRVLVDGGIMCINIGDATRNIDGKFQCFPNFAMVTYHMYLQGFTPLIPIHWRKISNRPNAFLGSGMIPTNGYVAQDHEYIAIFRKGNIRAFHPNDPNRYASAFTKEERDLWFRQVWEIQGARGAKDSSAFPEEIPYRLIRMFSVKGDTVLDPYSGTGTTMRVAEENDRIGIGYDIVAMEGYKPVRERIRRT